MYIYQYNIMCVCMYMQFLSYVLRAGDINELVVPMLYFMYEGRKDPSKIGLIHICTFVLLLLSGTHLSCFTSFTSTTVK